MITPETADAPKTPSPPPVAGDSGNDLAALKRKVAELEKALAGKTKEAAAARDAAAKEKKKCEAAVKASADKDVRIKELEAKLAQALAKVASPSQNPHSHTLSLSFSLARSLFLSLCTRVPTGICAHAGNLSGEAFVRSEPEREGDSGQHRRRGRAREGAASARGGADQGGARGVDKAPTAT